MCQTFNSKLPKAMKSDWYQSLSGASVMKILKMIRRFSLNEVGFLKSCKM